MKVEEDAKRDIEAKAAEVAKAVVDRSKASDAGIDKLALASQRRAIAYGRARGCP